MSAGLEHVQCVESLGAYALGALPETEAELVRRHLEVCRECRAELEWLRAAVDALPASVTPIEPPPELKARVMEIVESEATLLRAAGEAADRPPASGQRERQGPLRLPGWMAAVGLAAAGVAAVVIVLLAVSAGSGTRTIPVRVTEASLARQVRATLHVHGGRAQLQVAGLPAPAADHVDQLWVEHGSRATPESAGTFVVQSGSVTLTRPVRSGDLVLVTVEPGNGSPAPTTKPLLVARV